MSATTAPHVYQAINEVTAKMAGEGISKDRKNQQQGYSFRGIDDVYSALARVVSDAKLCILPRVKERFVVERPTKTGGSQTFTTLIIDFDLVSAVDGSKHTITTVGEAQDSADKSSNKAMSAAMKYACLIAFQIPTVGDNDADAHHSEKMPPGPPATLAPQLAASIEWVEWAKAKDALLRSSKNMGELQERWKDIYDEAIKAPNGTAKRLAETKDAMKAKLSPPQPESRA